MCRSLSWRYIMNSGEGDVCIIDLREMRVAARHKAGVNPFGGGLRALGHDQRR